MGRGRGSAAVWGRVVTPPPTMRFFQVWPKALGLTAAQQKELGQAQARWREATSVAGRIAPARTSRDEANKAYEQAVAAILQPPQKLLLEPILVRQEVGPGEDAAFTSARGAK